MIVMRCYPATRTKFKLVLRFSRFAFAFERGEEGKSSRMIPQLVVLMIKLSLVRKSARLRRSVCGVRSDIISNKRGSLVLIGD